MVGQLDKCANPIVPRHAHPRTMPMPSIELLQMKHSAPWGTPSAAQATTAASAASLNLLSAWYCSAPPPRAIFL